MTTPTPPPQIYPKFHHTLPPAPKKILIFLEPLPPPSKEIQNLEPKQIVRAYLYKKLSSEYTPSWKSVYMYLSELMKGDYIRERLQESLYQTGVAIPTTDAGVTIYDNGCRSYIRQWKQESVYQTPD